MNSCGCADQGLFSRSGLSARLVRVCTIDTRETQTLCRQIPVHIEDGLTLMMEIPETRVTHHVNPSELTKFRKEKYNVFDRDELDSATHVPVRDFFHHLSQAVPCVGCRKSIERLFYQLQQSGQPALEPIQIQVSGTLELLPSYLNDPSRFYALFYLQGSNCLNEMMEALPKSKRNRRCMLHSLDSHKVKCPGCWTDIWKLLSKDCREEITIIDAEPLLDTIEEYVRKHRFCSECKSKVLRAYTILISGMDCPRERGYCSALFEDIKSCPDAQHVHIPSDAKYIGCLIERAEPDNQGGERHAKTMEMAQEEVLTCIGIHLWERLKRIWQKMKSEEQSWQMLFLVGLDSMKKRFEMAVDARNGLSQIDRLVDEFRHEKEAKERRREQKRLKRKLKRAMKTLSHCYKQTQEDIEDGGSVISQDSLPSGGGHEEEDEEEADEEEEEEEREENGIFFENGGWDGFCSENVDESKSGCGEEWTDHETAVAIKYPPMKAACGSNGGGNSNHPSGLEDLLKDEGTDEPFISQEEINVFKAKKQEVDDTRKQLRKKVEAKFAAYSKEVQVCNTN